MGSGRERQLILAHALHSAGTSSVAICIVGGVVSGRTGSDGAAGLTRYLLLAMIPFAIAAPALGWLFGRGRRCPSTVLSACFVARVGLVGLLAATLGTPVHYAVVFALLACQKAHTVAMFSRMASVVRSTNERLEANARLNRASIIAGGLASVLTAGLVVVLPLRACLLVAAGLFIVAVRLVRPSGPAVVPVDSLPGRDLFPSRFARRASGWAAVASRAATGVVVGLIAVGSSDAGGGGIGSLLALGACLSLGSGLGTVAGPRTLRRIGVGSSTCALAVAVTTVCAAIAAGWPRLPALAVAAVAIGLTGNLCKQVRDQSVQSIPDERGRQLSMLGYDGAGQITWAAAAGSVALLQPSVGTALVLIAVGGAVGLLTLVGAELTLNDGRARSTALGTTLRFGRLRLDEAA